LVNNLVTNKNPHTFATSTNTGTMERKKKAGRPKSDSPKSARITALTEQAQKARFVLEAELLGMSEGGLLKQAANIGLETMGIKVAL